MFVLHTCRCGSSRLPRLYNLLCQLLYVIDWRAAVWLLRVHRARLVVCSLLPRATAAGALLQSTDIRAEIIEARGGTTAAAATLTAQGLVHGANSSQPSPLLPHCLVKL